MTNRECNEFNSLYCALSEEGKRFFSEVTMKLLKLNFILKVNNAEAYMFICNNVDILNHFFSFMNFEFIHRADKDLAYIKAIDGKPISKLNKNETICLLTLRLLYQEKSSEVSLSDDIEVTVKELQDKLFSVGFNGVSEKIKKTLFSDMLRTFKQHNIIYYKDDFSLDDNRIIIYPSIEVVMDFKEIDEVITKIESFEGGEDNYD